jgi:hypothetical protein
LLSIAIAFVLMVPTTAMADDAKAILKAMSDYLTAQKTFSFDYQSSIEAVTPEFEKLQFISSGSATIERPDKLRLTRKGGFVDLDVSFDGKKLIVHGKNLDAYADIDAKGTLDDLFNQLADNEIDAPGADILSADSYNLLMQEVTEAKHIASAVVGGIDCEYLTFRTPEVDWQIWIASGPMPVPVKYVVTTKHVAQAPQYTLQISNFKTGGEVAKASFGITIPAGIKEVDLSEIDMIDELPTPGEGTGVQQ